MSSESDDEYANRFDRVENRYHHHHRYRYYYDDDDDEGSRSNRYNRDGHRSASSPRNRHQRRDPCRLNYSHEKLRRHSMWTSPTAARIMAVCLLFSFAAYEVSILRAPLATDIFHTVPNTQQSVKLDRTSSYRSKTNNSDQSINLSPVYISSQPQSGLRSPLSSTSAFSATSPALMTSSISNRKSENASPPSRPSIKKEQEEQQIRSPRLSSEVPADSDAGVDLPAQGKEQQRTSSDEKPSDTSTTESRTVSEHNTDDGGDRSSSFRPLRRRRHKRSNRDALSESTVESLSSNFIDKISAEPISALRINVSEVDEPADKGEQSMSSKPIFVKKENSAEYTEDAMKDRERNVDQKTVELNDGKKGDSIQSINSTNGGSEPGAGQNFWQWFQESKGSANQSILTSVQCPNDVKRLCTMFYKYLRKYKVRTVYDASCGKNIDWMPEVLRTVGGELWGFKYYCCSNDEKEMERAKEKLSSISYVEFVSDTWWKTGFPKEIEMLFAWDTLAHIAFGRVWNFFVKAKSSGIKYILIDNYPSITNDPSPNRQFINVRRHPFKFPQAKEVVQNVTEPGETLKRQLLFYETESLPENLQ